MATANMVLNLPTVSVTLGPIWASQLNDALTSIDAHDHTTGKGIKITPAGMNMSENLSMLNHQFTDVSAIRMSNGALLNTISTVFESGGELYWNDAVGNRLKITQAGTLNASEVVSNYWPTRPTNTDLTIPSNATYITVEMDTTLPHNVTLPLAAAAGNGRFFAIVDASGGAQAITIICAGSDTCNGYATRHVTGQFGACLLVSDGVSKWQKLNAGTVDLAAGYETTTGTLPGIRVEQASDSNQGVITLARDLAGSSTLPIVTGLTGVSGVVRVGPSAGTTDMVLSVSAPSATYGRNIALCAGASASTYNAGTAQLKGGNAAGSGDGGAASLNAGDSSTAYGGDAIISAGVGSGNDKAGRVRMYVNGMTAMSVGNYKLGSVEANGVATLFHADPVAGNFATLTHPASNSILLGWGGSGSATAVDKASIGIQMFAEQSSPVSGSATGGLCIVSSSGSTYNKLTLYADLVSHPIGTWGEPAVIPTQSIPVKIDGETYYLYAYPLPVAP